MRSVLQFLTLILFLASSHALAQENTTTSNETETLIKMNTAVLQTLDKVTGRTGTANVQVGETVKLGTLFLSVQTCQKTPPIEQPEAAAFIQVWQPNRDDLGKIIETEPSEWVFSGWMFASSPSVSAMDHSIYDVWVIDCR